VCAGRGHQPIPHRGSRRILWVACLTHTGWFRQRLPIYFEGRCRSVKSEELNELNEGGLIRVCDDVESASLLPVSAPRNRVERGRARALRSELGDEHGYDLFNWNCEHFATWCVTGVAASRKIGNVSRSC